MKRTLITIVAALALMAAAFFIGRWTKPDEHWEQLIPSVPVVTTQWRTQRIEGPRPITERVVRKEYIPVRDTMTVHDTLYVVLDRLQKEYGDSLYTAWVSGIEPALDSIHLHIPEKTVTITLREKPKRWGLAIQGGYGATLQDNVVRLSPYIGVGISYNIVRW